MNTAYTLAEAEIGTVEWKDGSNPKVVAYFKDAGHPTVTDDATAWCAAFVGAMLARSGRHGTGMLNARSYLNWGTPVDRADAQPGDIVILSRGKSTWQGHVGFFVRDNGSTITILGGNQADAVNRRAYRVDGGQLLGIRRGYTPMQVPVVKPVVVSIDHRHPSKTHWLMELINAIWRQK